MDLGAKKNPSVFSELGGTENMGGVELHKRLGRYAKAHDRALSMSDYIEQFKVCQSDAFVPLFNDRDKYVKLITSLRKCGDWLHFRNYFLVKDIRLVAADFCKKHLLCPLCAIRRGSKYMKAYSDKYAIVLNQNSQLKPYFVTLTIKNGDDLLERFNHLTKSMKKLRDNRRNFLLGKKGYKFTEFCRAAGGVYSIEFKRGENSGLWHPHVHMLWLCDSEPNIEQLSKEWKDITRDSHVVDCRALYGDLIQSFCEIFKYALKFTNMDLSDNLHAFEVLTGKRLINSFGLMRGVVVPENLEDELLENEPYYDYFYQYFNKSYQLANHG